MEAREPAMAVAVLPGAPHNANYTAADALASVTEAFLDRVLGTGRAFAIG